MCNFYSNIGHGRIGFLVILYSIQWMLMERRSKGGNLSMNLYSNYDR